ncbi:alcohol dehydrogenase [Halosolutus gelatinilyticus]|uniref:alcohol dehydrogenase n=1 Tax=Halosolutus gelatinilyticus TaxID=2931975 RepID=UPI001FF53BF8|nr:alcohol dehydrogenase [Halosolutus gelatinilyticus]
MRAIQIPDAGDAFESVELPIPEPDPDEVRIAVEACGVCHSDVYVREGIYPGIEYPRIPGHEIAGRIDAVGDQVEEWSVDDRVGVGWHGGHCFTCDPCRRGDFQGCENGEITGLTFDGGYAEYATVPAEAVGRIPDALDAVDAAPLLCAGITTFNALRHADADPGDLVAVQGIGGLGHLGIQYSHEMGFETVALSHSADKEELAIELGADHFVDTSKTDASEALQSMGGAQLVLATAPVADAIADAAGSVGRGGSVVAVGIPGEAVPVDIQHLVGTRGSVAGWASGHAKDWEDTLEFSALRDVTPILETFPLSEAEDAYDRMLANDARFRIVLEP